MNSIRTLIFITSLFFSLTAMSVPSIGEGAVIGPGGDSGFTGGGGGGTTTSGGGGGGSTVGVGSGNTYLPADSVVGLAPVVVSTPTYGIGDVKIVSGQCVITKLGITGAIAGSPCAKLYPTATTTSSGTGEGTGVVLGTGTSSQNYSNNIQQN